MCATGGGVEGLPPRRATGLLTGPTGVRPPALPAASAASRTESPARWTRRPDRPTARGVASRPAAVPPAGARRPPWRRPARPSRRPRRTPIRWLVGSMSRRSEVTFRTVGEGAVPQAPSRHSLGSALASVHSDWFARRPERKVSKRSWGCLSITSASCQVVRCKSRPRSRRYPSSLPLGHAWGGACSGLRVGAPSPGTPQPAKQGSRRRLRALSGMSPLVGDPAPGGASPLPLEAPARRRAVQHHPARPCHGRHFGCPSMGTSYRPMPPWLPPRPADAHACTAQSSG
jgi:hypothetical protein